MQMKTLYKKNIITSYLQMFIAIVLPLIVTPYILNGLGQLQYGLWVLLTSITAYFGLSSFGFTSTLLKDSSSNLQDFMKLSKLVSVTFFSFVFFSLLTTIIFVFVYFNLHNLFTIEANLLDVSKNTFLITFLIFIISFFGSVFDTLLFASNRLYIKNIVDIVKNILAASSNVYVVYLGYGIFEIALVSLGVTIVYFFILLVLSRNGLNYSIRWKYFEIELFKNMLQPSIHYFIIGIAVLVVFYTDNLIIGSFISLSAVAIYSLGYKIVDATQKVLFKISDVLLPNISVLYSEHKYSEILKLHNKIMLISVGLAIPAYSLLYFSNQLILSWWLGSDNVLDKDIMTLFIIFSLIHTWVHVSSIFVAAIGIHKETSYMALFEAFLNIALSILFLKIYGLFGVALGTLVAHILTNGWFVNYWFYRNINKLIKEKK